MPEFAIGNGMISSSKPATSVVVSGDALQPPRAAPASPRLGSGRHELVVHWPGEDRPNDFRRTFRDGAGCLKARAAVLDEHERRIGAIAVNSANRGVIIAVELEAPYAICMPIE